MFVTSTCSKVYIKVICVGLDYVKQRASLAVTVNHCEP